MGMLRKNLDNFLENSTYMWLCIRAGLLYFSKKKKKWGPVGKAVWRFLKGVNARFAMSTTVLAMSHYEWYAHYICYGKIGVCYAMLWLGMGITQHCWWDPQQVWSTHKCRHPTLLSVMLASWIRCQLAMYVSNFKPCKKIKGSKENKKQINWPGAHPSSQGTIMIKGSWYMPCMHWAFW